MSTPGSAERLELTYEGARLAAEAAGAVATRRGVAPVVAVVDTGGEQPAVAELERDLDKCRAYVALLQQICQAHHIAVPDGPAFLQRSEDLPVSA